MRTSQSWWGPHNSADSSSARLQLRPLAASARWLGLRTLQPALLLGVTDPPSPMPQPAWGSSPSTSVCLLRDATRPYVCSADELQRQQGTPRSKNPLVESAHGSMTESQVWLRPTHLRSRCRIKPETADRNRDGTGGKDGGTMNWNTTVKDPDLALWWDRHSCDNLVYTEPSIGLFNASQF